MKSEQSPQEQVIFTFTETELKELLVRVLDRVEKKVRGVSHNNKNEVELTHDKNQ